MTPETKFNFLGDFIVVINPFMNGNDIVLSPGDIAIGVGLCELLWSSGSKSFMQTFETDSHSESQKGRCYK